MSPALSVTGLSSLKCPARRFCRLAHGLGALSRRCIDGKAREADGDASTRLREHPQLPRRTGSRRCAGAEEELGARGGIDDDSKIFIRSPPFEETVTSTAKTPARREA